MKNTFYRFCYTLVLFLVACNKTENEPDSTTTTPTEPLTVISGKWKVINDSLANIGNYYNGGFPNPGNYIGNSSDFMDFKSNGDVVFNIYYYSGTCKYTLSSDSTISIINFQPAMHKAKIINKTGTSLTLYATDTSSNGGILIKVINLKR